MLELLFGFRGRISRLEYVLTLVGTGVALIVLCAVLVGLSMGGGMLRRPDLGMILIGGLAMVVGAVLTIWISLALQAKRLRDIGLDPILVLPLMIGFTIIDSMTVRAMPGLAVRTGAHQSLLAVLVHLGFLGMLLFWPGRASGGGGVPAAWVSDNDMELASPFPAQPSMAAAPVAAAGGWPPPARTGFGRRGL